MSLTKESLEIIKIESTMKEEHSHLELRVETKQPMNSTTKVTENSAETDSGASPVVIQAPRKLTEEKDVPGQTQTECSNFIKLLTSSPTRSECYLKEARKSIARCVRQRSETLKIQCNHSSLPYFNKSKQVVRCLRITRSVSLTLTIGSIKYTCSQSC